MNKVKCLQQDRISSIMARERAKRGHSSSDQDVTVSVCVCVKERESERVSE